MRRNKARKDILTKAAAKQYAAFITQLSYCPQVFEFERLTLDLNR